MGYDSAFNVTLEARTGPPIRRWVTLTPAAHEAASRHRKRIGGKYSAAVCSLVIGADDRMRDRLEHAERLLFDLSKQLGHAMSCCPPHTAQAKSLEAAGASCRELQRVLAALG